MPLISPSRWGRSRRLAVWTALGVSLLLAGCSDGAGRTPAGGAASTAEAGPLHALKSCLDEAGFPATVAADGSLEWAQPPGQEGSADRAFQACKKRVEDAGLFASRPGQPTRNELRSQYDALVQLKACLERQGFTIGEPPSFDVYAEAQGGNWHPYESLPHTPQDLERAEKACPQP